MNIGNFLSASAELNPQHTAFVWGEERVSYQEADARTDALALALQDRGVRPGDRIAVLMWNCPQMIETFFAAWKIGAAVVPLNARFVRDEVVFHVEDSGASVLVFGEEFRDVIAGAGDMASVKEYVCLGEPASGQHSYEAMIAAQIGGRFPAIDLPDDALAWLFYTSGTTGRPKGAMLTQGNLLFMAVGWVADLMPLEPEDVGLHAAPLSHGAGFHAIALTLKGATQVIMRPHNFSAENFCATVERHRVTNSWLVPTQIKVLLNEPDLGRWDLESLRRIVYGGAPMYVEDLREAIQRIGPVFVQIYGQGETPMTGTYLRPEEHVLEGPNAVRLASCGHARSGIELRIVDESDNEVARGETGELCVRGPSVMAGYWERPEVSEETLRGGWLHTGDIGTMDGNGYVYLLDRSKDMLISGGANVYPREVEEVLLRHPDVSEACVFGVPDDLWGEAVKAVIVLVPGAQTTEEEILSFASEHMAGYKKPKSIDFAIELPKNAYGKVLKRELRAAYWQGQDRMVR